MSEHLQLAARKRKYRRISIDGPVNPISLSKPMIFDRLEYLQQQLRTGSPQPAVELLLVSHDAYLSLALTRYIFRHIRTHLCSTLEEVTWFFEQKPIPRIVIDLDGIAASAISVLNTLRQWHQAYPGIIIILLTAGRNPAASCLIVAAANCSVIERRLPPGILSLLLMQQPCSQPSVQANYTRQNDALTRREWRLLMALAQGDSLKTVAASLNKPYHSVVYTLGRLAKRIGLASRKALIHLLNELSTPASERRV
ncbi:helix-turn-helix transcriptional regulator [Dryocola sp. LX212]